MKQQTKLSLDNYVINGWEPGEFLVSVLENDLMGALGKADIENRRDIFEICQYVYNELPADSHGSPDRVRAWLNRDPDKIRIAGELWMQMKTQ